MEEAGLVSAKSCNILQGKWQPALTNLIYHISCVDITRGYAEVCDFFNHILTKGNEKRKSSESNL